MSRLITPTFLLVVTLSAAAYNTSPSRKVVFPFLDHITIDPQSQGTITVALLAVGTLVALVFAVGGILRERAD